MRGFRTVRIFFWKEVAIVVLMEKLQRVIFLQPFIPAHLRQIAALAHLHEYEAQDVIFREGCKEKDIFLVLEGEVALEITVPDMGVIQIHKVGAGELLGWSAVLGCAPMKATARALTLCRLAALDVGQLMSLMEANPKFGMAFFRRMAEAMADRLHATRLQLSNIHRQEMLAMHEGAD